MTTPADGEWSYHPATQIIFANPLGDADPVTEVFVPHYAFNVHIQDPSAYLTFQYLTFEGSRGRSIDARAEPPTTISGLVLRHLIQRYVPRHFILTNGARGLSIEDNLTEYGCRGMSWSDPAGDGCFGYRVFGATNSIIRRNVIRHLGAAGRRKLSGGINGWPCSWAIHRGTMGSIPTSRRPGCASTSSRRRVDGRGQSLRGCVPRRHFPRRVASRDRRAQHALAHADGDWPLGFHADQRLPDDGDIRGLLFAALGVSHALQVEGAVAFITQQLKQCGPALFERRLHLPVRDAHKVHLERLGEEVFSVTAVRTRQ